MYEIGQLVDLAKQIAQGKMNLIDGINGSIHKFQVSPHKFCCQSTYF